MPTLKVSRSIVIKAPLNKIKQSLVDFRQWPIWSPWIIMEPDTLLNYNDKQGQVGASYDWRGELVGQGGMELSAIHDHHLDMQLNFIKPFKSSAQVSFDLEEEFHDHTTVTWTMNGSLPFFLFFMVSKMKALIGKDYERGLRMLKEYIERGKVSSSVSIDGISQLKSQTYIGFKRECSIEEMPQLMPQDFLNLYKVLDDKGLQKNVVPFTIYNTFDLLNGKTEYIAAVPISETVDLTEPYFIGQLDAQEALKITHTGSYQHLGNAWATAMNYSRSKKIKTRKSPMGLEFYLNDPANTPSEELLTEVYLPLK